MELFGEAPPITLHTRNFITVLVAAVAYLNYPTVDPRGRVRQIPINEISPSYDFIIVGAGSAGAVVANRLSANPNWNVLLIEAGGDETAQTDVPLLTRDLYFTQYDWNYTTTFQNNICNVSHGMCNWPMGRILGGSSVLSDAPYVRGNRRDYDNWAALGNPGWSYNEILPYFRLSEDNQNPLYRRDKKYHGVGGYLTVSNSPFVTPLGNAYIEAAQELGYPSIDINGAHQTGFMIPQATLRNGTRCSTAKGFLRPIRNRPNFFVSYYSQVTQILIGEVNHTAYGVQFMRNNQSYKVLANKEIIVSAGTVNTAHLLLLSGIGPSKELKKFNIPVYSNIPVGQNLIDHNAVSSFFTVNRTVTITRSVYESGLSILKYAQNGTGPLTDPLATEAIGFMSFPGTNRSEDYPDFEVIIASSLPDHMNQLQLWYMAAIPLHPKSSGFVTLQSSNPFQAPLINPRYFTAPGDFELLIQAAQMAYNISQTNALQKYGTNLYRPLYSNCLNFTPLTQSYWRCVIINYSSTVNHYSGTCRMGPSSDNRTVVDNHLRVHGIRNLRVIDGSIIPTLISGNTNAGIIMIGERGSAWIYQDHNDTNPSPAT